MNETRRAEQWPAPQHGDGWWSRSDRDVGTADYGSSYLWDVRIRLQLRVSDGIVIDARCHVEDWDSAPIEAVIASSIANHLRGKPVGIATTFRRAEPPANRTWWDRETAVRDGQLDGASHPADLMWSVSFAEDATRLALADWATKAPGRTELLPPPPAPVRPPLLRRILRRIPFFRALGV